MSIEAATPLLSEVWSDQVSDAVQPSNKHFIWNILMLLNISNFQCVNSTKKPQTALTQLTEHSALSQSTNEHTSPTSQKYPWAQAEGAKTSGSAGTEDEVEQVQ